MAEPLRLRELVLPPPPPPRPRSTAGPPPPPPPTPAVTPSPRLPFVLWLPENLLALCTSSEFEAFLTVPSALLPTSLPASILSGPLVPPSRPGLASAASLPR